MKQKITSIILTIHDQQDIIQRVVKSIIDNKSEYVKELIVIFDACKDKSEQYTKEILDKVKDINVIYNYADDLYELKCNNIGLKQSTCNYSLIIQDDMIIQEKDFDKRMLKPFIFPDTFGITSRIAHNYINVSDKNNPIAWTDPVGFDPYNANILPTRREMFTIRDVSNRGPLMLDNEKTEKLNYLDEIFWPLNLDEHDICLRAWINYGWVSGSFWIKWTSKEEWGGTRKTQEKYLWFEECGRKNKQTLFERHQEYIVSGHKHNESRFIL
ncbi:MAG: glycosyltransferase [Clostridia bacterium]